MRICGFLLSQGQALAALCALGALATAPPLRATDRLLESAKFQKCEAEAFVSVIMARNAMQLNTTRESLLAASGGPAQTQEVNELFDAMDRTKSKDHGQYAARKFYDCARREQLGVMEDIEWAAVCLARHDIVFYVGADRTKGTAQSEASNRAKRTLGNASSTRYPEALVDVFVPMVYRVQSPDDDYLLRRFIFESCLFPDDFKRLMEANQAGAK